MGEKGGGVRSKQASGFFGFRQIKLRFSHSAVRAIAYRQRPLSVTMACPVMHRERSLARNRMTLA